MATQVRQAEINAPIYVLDAEAEIEAKLATNEANMKSYQ